VRRQDAGAAGAAADSERRDKRQVEGAPQGARISSVTSSSTDLVSVRMPQMGESLAEGTLVRWLKKPGDAVRRDEPLFEISTDKVDTDVPSPVAGVLKETLVREGETVAIGVTVATIQPVSFDDAPAGAPASESDRAEAEPGAGPLAPPEPAGHFKADRPPQLIVRRREAPVAAIEGADGTGSTFSPAVLDAARRAALPLETLAGLTGSGRGGRITRRDVERFLAARASSSGAGRDPSASAFAEAPREYVYVPTGDDRIVPMTPVRKKIAGHMTWSTRISPHATAFAECDMSAAAAAIAAGRARLAEEWGAPLTYTVIAASAVIEALGAFPALNASVVGDALAVKPHVNLGVAVAIEESDELVVPVVHRAEQLTLADLARAIRDLAARARARQLSHAEVQGGSFTLTNPGIYGGLTGTPILHQPQVGIVGLGAITKRPVVVNDAIAIRPVMMIALTFDHRAADGMLAFRFLEHMRRRLEERPLG
jgi:2-oxoglutarate dehydrogenase E2 component (dihydrolipoamide succinyltransferase)